MRHSFLSCDQPIILSVKRLPHQKWMSQLGQLLACGHTIGLNVPPQSTCWCFGLILSIDEPVVMSDSLCYFLQKCHGVQRLCIPIMHSYTPRTTTTLAFHLTKLSVLDLANVTKSKMSFFFLILCFNRTFEKTKNGCLISCFSCIFHPAEEFPFF